MATQHEHTHHGTRQRIVACRKRLRQQRALPRDADVGDDHEAAAGALLPVQTPGTGGPKDSENDVNGVNHLVAEAAT